MNTTNKAFAVVNDSDKIVAVFATRTMAVDYALSGSVGLRVRDAVWTADGGVRFV